MPANLPPQYFEVEKRFRAARDPEEKIAALEEMMAIMPKHKGTDHLRAELRTKIAKLSQLTGRRSGARRSAQVIEKEGAAQVAVVGPTGAGKSRLVARVTNATPLVADYPFVTREATPGMMPFENIQIQLIDTPALAPQTIEFWLAPLLRRADALLIVLDSSGGPVAQMEDVIARLKGMRISLGVGVTGDDIILATMKAVIAANKIDRDPAGEGLARLKARYGNSFPIVAISAQEGTGLEELKRAVFNRLDIIRVHTKEPGQRVRLDDPIVLPRGSTVADAAAFIHKDFSTRMKYTRIWGSGKHDGVMAKRDHVLQDGDIVELHL